MRDGRTKRDRCLDTPGCCYYCHGIGYVERITDASLIQCAWCDGTGKSAWPPKPKGVAD